MSFDEIFDLTAGVYFNFYNIYIAIQLFFFFWRDRYLARSVFQSRPQYVILETRILYRSNRFVRAPSSGGGSNAPRLASSIPHLDVNADGG